MKIGIISDIHAYLDPLHRALALFENERVDHVICAGDVVDRGREGDAVVDFIIAHDIPTVLGNHDSWAYKYQSFLRRNRDLIDDDRNGVWLKTETVEYVSSLPLTRHFDWDGYTVCLSHGTPWRNLTYVAPDADREMLRHVVDTAQADIVILGHTHIPMQIMFGSVWILNPGSLAFNRHDHRRTCGILTLPDVRFEVFDVDSGKRARPESAFHPDFRTMKDFMTYMAYLNRRFDLDLTYLSVERYFITMMLEGTPTSHDTWHELDIAREFQQLSPSEKCTVLADYVTHLRRQNTHR